MVIDSLITNATMLKQQKRGGMDMKLSKEKLLWIYRTMMTIRLFDEAMFREATVRTGFGSVHFSVGQEAVSAGIGVHLTNDDYVASTHRPHGHCIAKGMDMTAMAAEIFGRAIGSNKGKGGDLHLADMSIGMLGANGVVCGNTPWACGAALKAKLAQTDQVSVAYFGDGGAGQGVLYESMNLASIWNLPVIFVCENNLYANATPVEYAIAGKDIADRAIGFGMPGKVVDGMDVFSVYEAAENAISRARKGEGPSLLECKTYRYYGHFFGDNPLQYRLKEEEAYWQAKDPINGFRKRVEKEGVFSTRELDNINQELEAKVENAVADADKAPEPQDFELFTDVYKNYPLEALKRGYKI